MLLHPVRCETVGDTLRAAAILETDLLTKKNALRWAMLHIKMGKTDDIINRLPKDSMTVNDWLRLASLTDIRKLYAVSVQIYKNALKLDEGNQIVLNNYAYAAMQSPGFNHDEVLKAVKKAYVALSERPEVLQTYAEALNKCGKPAECIKLLKEKTTQVKQSANLLYQLGSAYEKTGDIRGAISSYKMALAFPESTPDWPSEVSRRDLMTRTEELTNKIDKK